jgi:hypothetical protein
LVNYYLIEGNADQVISISIFDSKGHADLSSGPLGYCMRKVLGDCLLGQPQIVSGQTEGEEQRRNVLNQAGVSASGASPSRGHEALDEDHLSVSLPGSTSFTAGRSYHLLRRIVPAVPKGGSSRVVCLQADHMPIFGAFPRERRRQR